LSHSGGHDPNICHEATYEVSDNGAFWSITVYGNDGFMKSDKNIVNSSNVKLNRDNTFTLYFGSVQPAAKCPTGWTPWRDGTS
jgi:hypothetical protein